jgi:hypothetical protein
MECYALSIKFIIDEETMIPKDLGRDLKAYMEKMREA